MNWMQLGNRVVRRALELRGAQSLVRRVRGVDLHHYRVEGTGTGPPLLLVHGLGSSANAFFRTLLPLARTFRQVWAVDLPGHGFSPLPASGPLPVREFVEVLLEFRRTVIGQPVFLLGNSLGGAFSLLAASHEPTAFAALGLVSPAGARLEPELLAELKQAFQLESAQDARGLANRLFVQPPLLLLLFAHELRKMVSTPAVRRIVEEATVEDTVSEAMLARLTMPTLLVWGREEKLLPPEALSYFRAHLPATAEIHEVEGFGHMPHVEAPAALVALLARFARDRHLG